jgi:recombinational DNA repair protein (RecF pathway)
MKRWRGAKDETNKLKKRVKLFSLGEFLLFLRDHWEIIQK